MTSKRPIIVTDQDQSTRQLISLAEKQFSEAELFYGHGTDNPYDEAVYLVLRSLDLPFDIDEPRLDVPLSSDQKERLMQLIERRIKDRVPVAYLLKEAWFAGLSFYVDERVLIPRSPIAELIEERFSPWIENSVVKNILDIGTGSACIAIACAYAFPEAKITATDISDGALVIADVNVDRHKVGGRVNTLKSDLFDALKDRNFDIIISNPPYVGELELSQLPAEYKHEPQSALEAGKDGLDIVRTLLKQAKQHLNSNGILIVEVGNTEQVIIEAFSELPFTWLEFEYGGEGVFLLTADDLKHL